jgi:L-asparaginase
MIVIVFTGGTISMRHDAASGGAVPSLRGRDILDLAPGLDRIADFEIDDWAANPGPHMTVERMWSLRQRLLQHLGNPKVDGIVVTHGTDSMEESAYLMARSIDSNKPVVFTGAMRTSSDLGWDGPANLGGAMRVASSPASRGRGVMLFMADRIHSALEVAKVDTSAVDAFASPSSGPVGLVDDGSVIFVRPTAVTTTLDPPEPAKPVDIIMAYTGADSRLLESSLESARGVVLAAMGRGNVPPEMLSGIDALIANGKPVVITSRTSRGRVGATYAYPGGGRRLLERGAIMAGSRSPQQARIDLMLALGSGMSVDEVRQVFAAD